MMNADLEKLLGAFATDTLTREEREQLYAAALSDQQLFNALADEQGLKELLADPEVRRRLLESLRHSKPAASGVANSWFAWATRPATLAVAGGLSAAVLAVVLGIKLYQDSLKATVHPPVTEDAPATTTPAQIAPAAQPRPAEPSDTPATPPQPSRRSQAPATSSGTHNQAERRKKEAVPSFREDRGNELPAPAQAPVPPASASSAMRTAPQASARALFYAGEQRRPEPHERPVQSAKERLQAGTPSRELLRSSAASGPLGLRYSMLVQEKQGRERETDRTTSLGNADQVKLTLQSNQDAYLQVWKLLEAQSPELIVPGDETTESSVSLQAGERLVVPLPMEQAPFRLAIRLARSPVAPAPRGEAPRFEIATPLQSQESSNDGPHQGPGTYVITQDPSPAARIEVDVPIAR